MLCRTCWIAALVACAGCNSEVDLTTGSTAGAGGASATASSGAGGTGGQLPSCLGRLTTPDGLPDIDAEFTVEGGGHIQIDSIDVGPSGEVAFAGSTPFGGSGHLLLNGAPIAQLGGIDQFVGVLAADGSLAWVTSFSDVAGALKKVVRFDDGGVVVFSSRMSLSDPFPPSEVMPGDFDPYWARFDSQGALVAFVPMGSSGGAAQVTAASPTSDGGSIVGGFFLNGMYGFPTGAFSGCGANIPLDHAVGFLARLAPDGTCEGIESIGTGPLTLLAMGGDSTSSGDRITIAGAYSASLELGMQQIDAPQGGAQAFFASATALSTGEAWGQLVGTAMLAQPDWSSGGKVAVSSDGSTVLVSDSSESMGGNVELRDVLGAFEVSITSPSGESASDVGVGRSPTGMIEDRPIFASGDTVEGATTSFGAGGAVDGSLWLALFDGAGQFCAAKASDVVAFSPIVGGSSVVFHTSTDTSNAIIRRMQLAELAE